MRNSSVPALALLLAAPMMAQPALTADEIMAKVAANVDAAEAARRSYVYRQTVRGTLSQSDGKLVRRERREYDVFPGESWTEKKLVAFEGEYRKGKTTIPYLQPTDEESIDSELLNDLIEDLVNDKESRDGIPRDLFPLSARDLPHYAFTLKEQTEYRGRPAYRLRFDPHRESFCHADGDDADDEDCDAPWRGEIWVDAEDLQPARITTDLAVSIPWGVRVFLGTNVKQLGFSVSYERVAPNVWFPVSYGTEFRLDVLFFYKRNIALSLESKDFRRTDAESTIQFEEPSANPSN